jgi:hypothetical protein
MGINPNNKITIIIRILFAVTLFQHVEYDEELGKICALPSSKMSWREILEFSLVGISRLKALSEATLSL